MLTDVDILHNMHGALELPNLDKTTFPIYTRTTATAAYCIYREKRSHLEYKESASLVHKDRR